MPEGTADGEDFASLLEASQEAGGAPAPRLRAGDLLTCRVLAVSASSIFVAVGDKAEGRIDLAEFRDAATGELHVTVGEVIQATVVDDGSRSGSAVLTRMLGRGGHAAAELEQARELGVPVEGLVAAETKGGFEIQIGSARAFCPGSQIDFRRGGERVAAAEYLGNRYPFRVMKVESDGRNVVVSRRVLLEEQARAEAEATLAKLHVGAVLDGTVRSLRDFGAFVDLGGVDGMIHVSELAYARVKHPSEVLQVGQSVRVQVVKLGTDKEGRRTIGLSLRALEEDPWSKAAERFPAGRTVPGTVTRLEAYGAFVQLEPGLEGLVHISKISPDRRLTHPRQVLAVDQNVEVTVLAVDTAQKRISLSMVEQHQKAREREDADERREQKRVMDSQRGSRSLGTLGDLLREAQQKQKKP
jgi:small subunit ribosomal protein S1